MTDDSNIDLSPSLLGRWCCGLMPPGHGRPLGCMLLCALCRLSGGYLHLKLQRLAVTQMVCRQLLHCTHPGDTSSWWATRGTLSHGSLLHYWHLGAQQFINCGGFR